MTAPAKLLTLDKLKAHQAYKNAKGQKIPGVTTVLGMIDKSFALTRWAWNLGRDGIDLDAARDQAMTIGTVAHALAEAYLRGMELDRSTIAPDVLDKAETSFVHFLDWFGKENLTVLRTEHVMCSERLQVGGTLDLLAQRNSNGRLVVADLKSAKQLYPEHAYQAAVYAAMYEETAGVTVDEVYVVRIPKDDVDGLEVQQVHNRPARVAAFAALAEARRQLLATGMKL